MVKLVRPPEGTERWTHHWLGPKDGDIEPWLWVEHDLWARGEMCLSPASMACRGWVYAGPCEPPEVVADLRRRLAAAEARLPPVVASIARATGGSDE